MRQRPESLVGWGIERVVTTGWRRGSDDAIGAGVLPLGADSVAAGIALAGAIAIGRREVPRVGHTRHAWRRTVLLETEGAAGAVE